MKQYFILFILMVLFNGCIENPTPKKYYIEKHNSLFYKKKIIKLQKREQQIIKSIDRTIEEYQRNEIYQKDDYSDIYVISKSISILKTIDEETSSNNFPSTFNRKRKKFLTIDEIIKILNNQLKGKSWIDKREIKDKIIFLKKIQKQRKEILERSIEIVKSINNDNTQKSKKSISKLIKEFKKVQKNKLKKYIKKIQNKKKKKKALKKFKKNQKNELKKYTKKIKRVYGQKRFLSFFEIKDTIEVLDIIKNKESLGVFNDIKKSIIILEKIKNLLNKKKILKYKKYSKQVLKQKEREEKREINSQKEQEKREKKLTLLVMEKKEKEKEIADLTMKIEKINALNEKKALYENNVNSSVTLDPSFFGKASYFKIDKSKQVSRKVKNNIKIKLHSYILINSIKKLEELQNTRTYVLFPRNLIGYGENDKTKKRYINVLKNIQALKEVSISNNDSDSLVSQHKVYENKFVLFGDKGNNNKLQIEQYNYEIANKILDILKEKIDASFFDKNGPFLITMTHNIFDREKDFEFLYIDLSEFNNSAITVVINSYKNKLVEDGMSDVKTLERFKLKLLSTLTNFNHRIHIFSELVAGEQ